jgi:hypothetical protein
LISNMRKRKRDISAGDIAKKIGKSLRINI